MNLKTDYRYEDFNFTENNGTMNELTVTITLDEYRTMVQHLTRDENKIEKLEAENKHYKTTLKVYAEILCKQNPDAIKKIVEAAEILTNEVKECQNV